MTANTINSGYWKQTPKEFIGETLVKGVDCLMKEGNYFMAFAVMANSIEFLGKCLDPKSPDNEWDSLKPKQGGNYFDIAIDNLEFFKNYRDINLRQNLRNGLAHFLAPKNSITLSSGKNIAHLVNSNGKININCENFYEDFKNACFEIINKPFLDPNDKMNEPFLEINTDQNTSVNTNPYPYIPSHATSSLATSNP